ESVVLVTAQSDKGYSASMPITIIKTNKPTEPGVLLQIQTLVIKGSDSVNESTSQTYTVDGIYTDGTTKDLSSIATWSSSNTGVATFSSGGVLNALSVNNDTSVTITVNVEGKSATKSIVVKNSNSPPPEVKLNSITINGASSLEETTSTTYSATGTYSDGTSKTITPQWSVSNSGLASITTGGLLTAKEVSFDSNFNLTASLSGVSVSKPVTVKNKIVPATLTSLSMNCPSTLMENTISSCSTVGTYSDGSSKSVTPNYSSSNSNVLNVNSYGSLTAYSVSADTAVSITASLEGKTTSSQVTVRNNQPVVASIALRGLNVLPEGGYGDYTCIVNFSDGNSDVYGCESLTSNRSDFVSISSNRRVTVKPLSSDTTVTLTGSYGGKSNTFTVSLTNKLSSIQMTHVYGEPTYIRDFGVSGNPIIVYVYTSTDLNTGKITFKFRKPDGSSFGSGKISLMRCSSSISQTDPLTACSTRDAYAYYYGGTDLSLTLDANSYSNNETRYHRVRIEASTNGKLWSENPIKSTVVK
ncbi:MAG: hypothetical protein KDK54_21765, partial [Leptospiraceae bacterium]|nr:hypothetical protein [Leptospiraceae bacterium]